MAVFQNYSVYLPLVHTAMNLADLCADGREKYEWFLKQRTAYQKFERVHMLLLMIHMHQKFKEHLEGCEVCTPMEDGQDE